MPVSNIYNFYVTEDGRVFKAPVTMPADEAKKVLQKELKQKGKKDIAGNLLHVCYDSESKRVYVPNASNFTERKKNRLLEIAQVKISETFGGYKGETIDGSPFSLLRIRNIKSFSNASEFIANKLGVSESKDMTIVEANLARMPSTAKHLPDIYGTEGYPGGYISPEFTDHVNFIEEIDLNGTRKKNPVLLERVDTPFILLNTSPDANLNSSSKERIIIAGYRDYLYDQSVDEIRTVKNISSALPVLYHAKHNLYMGWPFEEVCYAFIENVAKVQDFRTLLQVGAVLYQAASSLEAEGYGGIMDYPYYITFKVDADKFPLNISSLENNGILDPSRQISFLKIIEFEQDTGNMILETPIYIPPETCMKVFRSRTAPVITRFNSQAGLIDVKSGEASFQQTERNNKQQLSKIRALSIHDVVQKEPDKASDKKSIQFRYDARAVGISLSNPYYHTVRKLTDYHYATDHIKRMCQRRGVDFVDLSVLVGPIERILGTGTHGAYMSATNWKDKDEKPLPNPMEIEEGLFVSPPLIAINSVTQTTYDQQSSTLIHEYSHNIYEIQNPGTVADYQSDEYQEYKQTDPLRFWKAYLGDENEQQAHREQVKFLIQSGQTVDEIIRDKVGGAVTSENYPEALVFRKLIIDPVLEELKQEHQDEEPTRAT